MCFVNLSYRGIRNCKWNLQILSKIRINLRNPHEIAESAYICGIRLYLRNLEQLPIRLLRNPQKKTNVPTKFT